MIKILMTGGHAGTTGLSVIREIRKRKVNAEISWIGVRRAVSGSFADTLEYKIYPKYDVKFYSFETGKVQTKFTRYTIPLLLKIPLSFCLAFIKSAKLKPDVIVSFGGSISIPVCFYGFLFKIPVIVHEQTAVAGRANMITSRFASKIAISRISSSAYFDEKKVVFTGNPLSPEVVEYVNKKPRREVKTILLTGGSRGSVWINNAIKPLLTNLLKKYKIIWQIGDNNLQSTIDDFSENNLITFGQVDPSQMIKYESEADIVISRAGANTVAELIALKKPAILIPIPWSYLDEQSQNAKYMERLGMAKILPQKQLNPENLLSEINLFAKNYADIVAKMTNSMSDDIDASKRLVDLILDELYEKAKK